MVLEGEIERLNNENHNLQTAKSQMLLSFQECQQKLNDSDYENIIKNLKRKMEEALVEADAAWQRKVCHLGWARWVDVGCYENIHKNLKRKMDNAFDEAKKASATQVNDGVKSAMKDKTQELARVKAELTASQKKNDELKEVMEQQQKIGDARKTSQKETQTHWKLI
jgi:DNA phosphorothioation-dependent restriction protein DptG